MKNEFLKNLKSYNLEGFGVLLAVSGGKDSMTMLDLFNYFKYELKLNLVVCHFNHSLRDDADRDEKFVKTQCEKYGLKFYSKKEDVLVEERGHGLAAAPCEPRKRQGRARGCMHRSRSSAPA